MRRSLCLILGLALLLATGTASAEAQPALDTDEKKILYALGLALSQRLSGFDFTADELTIIQAGVGDGTLGRTARVDLPEWGPKIDGLMRARAEAAAQRERADSATFLAEAAKAEGAVVSESGVIYIETRTGTGAQPTPNDTVKIHYHGTLRSGEVFDSSIDAGVDPAEFQLNAVVSCFTEGVTKMKVGGKSRLICPADTAYGDRGAPPMIPGGATIVFDVELIEIVATPAPAVGD